MHLSNHLFILPLIFAIIGTPLAFAQVELNHVDIFCPLAEMLDFTQIVPLLVMCPVSFVDPLLDSDGDGLLDDWEINGIDGSVPLDGIPDFILVGADPMRADIYVEIDHMTGRAPFASEINDVIDAFANSPYQNPDNNADGITLHVDSLSTSDEITFADEWTFVGNDFWPDFDSAKLANFGTQAERGTGTQQDIDRLNAKFKAYHYTIFINHRNGTSSTGIAEGFGNDFVVALGPTLHFIPGLQSGTFMHELGHNLDLGHGGGDDVNCKPNYLSVMSYARQSPWTLKLFGNLITDYMTLDYSHSNLTTLNENSLDEPDGVEASTPLGLQTLIGPFPFNAVIPTGVPHNWNIDFDTNDLGVQRDINFILPESSPLRLCFDQEGLQILDGHDDWDNLRFNFQDNVNTFADGVHLDLREEEIEGDVLEAYVDAVTEPVDGIRDIIDQIQQIIDNNPGTSLEDKLEDAISSLETALVEINKNPADNQAALGNIEGAVGDIEAAVNEGLDQTTANNIMDILSGVARHISQDAIDIAIATLGSDPGEIADAQQFLTEADTLRINDEFKDAVAKYKDALSKAESALP